MHSFETKIKVSGSLLNEFKDVLDGCFNGKIYKLGEENEVVGEYKASIKSYSYTGNVTDESTMYTYWLYLEQVINKKVESIKIDKLTVIPYEYEEVEDEDTRIITAKIKLTKEEMELFKTIESISGYFNVIRYGVSDNIVRMRFGKNIWSEHEDYFKVKVVLVEEIYDTQSKNTNTILQPEIENIMHMLAYERNLNNELINILLEKNIVTIEEIEVVKKIAEKNINESYRLFYKSNDVDRY